MMDFLSPIEAYEEDGIITFYIVDNGCKVVLCYGKVDKQEWIYEVAKQRLKRYTEKRV